MTIPIWYLSAFIILVCIASAIYIFGATHFLLTNNNIGVFSESPLLWTILITAGGPISFFCFRFFLIDFTLMVEKLASGWSLPSMNKITIQECCVTSLNSIWGFNNGGIRWIMLNNWIKTTTRKKL